MPLSQQSPGKFREIPLLRSKPLSRHLLPIPNMSVRQPWRFHDLPALFLPGRGASGVRTACWIPLPLHCTIASDDAGFRVFTSYFLARSMTIDTVAACVQAIRQFRLLSPTQLEELTHNLRDYPHPRGLAQGLLKAGWLTAFQVNCLLTGRGQELVLGPYILMERLGEGGVGNVFKARHVYMQRYVAIKFLRPDMVGNAEVVGRFYREVQAFGQLVHPNVVLGHDAGPCGNTHFLAMEYVEGTDLQKLVTQKGPLAIDQACDYIRQAALGLEHIHGRGLVHRDIKPSNLLVTHIEAGEGLAGPYSGQSFPFGLIKILDLGLARFDATYIENADDLTMAGKGGVRGSADFLAPEQAIDFHSADIRADIYSLGCTFYFLLAGKPPFDGGSLAQKLMKHQSAEPPSLEKKRGSAVPRRLPQIIARMMAKRPEDRYQTPAEVASAIGSTQQRSWLGLWRG
jgi:serine/threonine-protein kinase